VEPVSRRYWAINRRGTPPLPGIARGPGNGTCPGSRERHSPEVHGIRRARDDARAARFRDVHVAVRAEQFLVLVVPDATPGHDFAIEPGGVERRVQ
jgi:hypothetical protein